MSTTETQTWSSEEVADMTGLTYRQLDHWCRKGLFGEHQRDPGSGAHRRFGQHELLDVAVAARLSRTIRAITGSHFGGSLQLYHEVIIALHCYQDGEENDTDVEMDGHYVTINRTPFAWLTIDIGDLQRRFT